MSAKFLESLVKKLGPFLVVVNIQISTYRTEIKVELDYFHERVKLCGNSRKYGVTNLS